MKLDIDSMLALMADACRDLLVRKYGWKRDEVDKLTDSMARFVHINIRLDERDKAKGPKTEEPECL